MHHVIFCTGVPKDAVHVNVRRVPRSKTPSDLYNFPCSDSALILISSGKAEKEFYQDMNVLSLEWCQPMDTFSKKVFDIHLKYYVNIKPTCIAKH